MAAIISYNCKEENLVLYVTGFKVRGYLDLKNSSPTTALTSGINEASKFSSFEDITESLSEESCFFSDILSDLQHTEFELLACSLKTKEGYRLGFFKEGGRNHHFVVEKYDAEMMSFVLDGNEIIRENEFDYGRRVSPQIYMTI